MGGSLQVVSVWISLEGHKWVDDVQVWLKKNQQQQQTPTHKPFFCHTEYCWTPFPLTLIWCSTMSSWGWEHLWGFWHGVCTLGVFAVVCLHLFCPHAIFIGIRGCFYVVSNMQTFRQCTLGLVAALSASPGLPTPHWPRGWWCLGWLRSVWWLMSWGHPGDWGDPEG